MSQPRDDRQDDLFRSSLEAIINLRHPLVRLAAEINWDFLAKRFSSVCRVGPGQPPLPTRLVAGLFILKHMHNLSDEALCDRWVENPYFQYFCGEVVFRHELAFDRSSLTRWRQRLGEEQIAALLQESLSVAPQTSTSAFLHSLDPTRTWGAAIGRAPAALIFGPGAYPPCFNAALCAAKPAIIGARRE
jgi:hypothetical protein